MKSSYYLLSCVTALFLSLSLVSCESKGDEPSFLVGAVYSGAVRLDIVLETRDEINLDELKIVDQRTSSHTALEYTSETGEDGTITLCFDAPPALVDQGRVLRNRDRIDVRFALVYGTSSLSFRGIYEYQYNEKLPEGILADPNMILVQVTSGDYVFSRPYESERLPIESLKVKVHLRGRTLSVE